MDIKVGDKVRIYDFDDGARLTGEIGIVLAVGVKSVPNVWHGGAFEFETPRYAVQLEEVFNREVVKMHPNAGRIVYPKMNGTSVVGGKVNNYVERIG